MNAQEFLKLLKKWNSGIARGSQRNFAKKLNIAESSIANFIKGRQSPSEKLLKEMAKLLSTSEDNLQKIFDLSGSNNTFGNNSPVQINYNDHLEKELKLKDEQIKFLQEQVDFYKSKCEVKK
jgi:transcriptional regulator with XRE-family HTH domain